MVFSLIYAVKAFIKRVRNRGLAHLEPRRSENQRVVTPLDTAVGVIIAEIFAYRTDIRP
jgi:hypothetical protein